MNRISNLKFLVCAALALICLLADGRVVAQADAFTGGALTEDTALSADGSPYVISADIIVPTGITLTVEPGAALRFQAGRALRVEGGRLVAEGTSSQPILFTRDGADPWGAVVFQDSHADNCIVYATIEYARVAEANQYWQGVIAYDSDLRVERSIIRHLGLMGLTLERSQAQILDNEIYDVGLDGIHVVGGEVVARGNHVYEAYEGIELEHMFTPAVLSDNHVHHITDDCIDFDASLAVVERSELHHCGNKGISISYGSAVTLTNNLIYASAEGIAVQDGSTARIVNNTVVDNQLGVGLHKHYLESGGIATLVNCILWGNGTELELRDGSRVDVTYSNVEGGWPGEGNSAADPQFIAPQEGDYQLWQDSPCMDAASPAGAPGEDIRRAPRPQREGYDQGAYELSAQADSLIVINELQYHPRSDDHGEEYIELYNPGPAAVDLSGWRFSDGIEYTFPVSASIPSGGYVVVGHDPATVETVYGIGGVLGPFVSGRLSNGGERVAIEDSLGAVVDEVTYDDHLPWPEAADGDGPAMELINPTFDNDRPCSWGSSVGLGTPGAQNSVYSAGNIPPCITGVAHAGQGNPAPTMPTSSQPVTVTALVDDNSAVAAVTLYYRPQGASAYTTLPMSGGPVYTALIPPQSDGKYVEFYVTASDDEAATRTVPDGAPGTVSAETGLPVTVSYLYLVENTPPSGSLPIYRLIMTEENRTELITRDLYSNVLLDATFVYGPSPYYNVGVRYRGESTRDVWPRPYRIKFPDAREFEDRERINLVSDELGRESLAHDLFQRVGLPSSDTRFVTFYINASLEGDYLDVEQVDNDFLEAHFPGDDDGNLYRGKDGADLHYRGADPDDYAPYYLKKNNEDADDYADIIALTDALDNSSDANFRAEAEALADMRQWVRWFAVQAVLDNHEGALWIGQGDDYFLYRRPSDGRFILISWDHDCTFMYADHSIWEPNWLASTVVKRILNYPDFTRWYYQDIASIAANEFSVAEMYPRIDALPGVVEADERDWIRQYVAARIPSLNSQIPATTLSISTNGGDDFTTTGAMVTLEGNCSPLRDVLVNGGADGVSYPTATTYRYEGLLWDEDNLFTVSDGLDSFTITVHWDSFHGGTLTEDTLITTSPYPYAITASIIVPAEITLTVEPGVTFHFKENRYLRVNGGGRLLAEGTAAQPIVFTRQGSEYWGGILLDQTQEDNRIAHAVIEYTREVISNPRSHGVSAYGACVTISDSVIRHTDFSVAVQTYPWMGLDPTVYLLRNEIYDIQRDAVHVTGGYAYIQGNHIYDVRHGAYEFEGIEVSHMDVTTPAVLLDNHVHDVSDDCLDLNDSSAIIERNELHHCGDKGISIGDPSSTTLVNNLVYSCLGKSEDPHSGACIAVKDGAVSYIMNNTVADCRRGVYVYEGHAGDGGGSATVVNSILWGHSIAALELDALSTVAVTYSDIEGGWAGEGNIDLDPLFRGPQSGIYRLLEESPCVDTGTAAGAPDVDVRGVYRPHGEGYERGAHEFFEFFSVYLPLAMRGD